MRVTPFALVASLAVVAGCAADSTGPAAGRGVSVSFQASGAPTASNTAVTSSAAALALTSAADSLKITKVEIVLARLELQRSGATTCISTEAAGDDHDSDSCKELELAPSVVTIPVDGTVASALKVDVPAGTYSSLESKIRALSANGKDGTSAFLTAHPDLAGVSVRVTGTFNGKAFTYTGSPRSEFETSFVPPIVVDSGGVNVTIHVDLATWFTNRAGVLIDPATANTGGVNAALVAENIKRSFRAFRDDNHDGHEDAGEHSDHKDH